MWGKVIDSSGADVIGRIIPTDVGKSATTVSAVWPDSDHPHGCGEKYGYAAPVGAFPGSSPRMWGKVLLSRNDEYKHRIIPTDVGKRPIYCIDIQNTTQYIAYK